MLINLLENISIEIPQSKIGVLVSGGADSALLLYFLLTYSKNTVYIFSLATKNKFSTNTKNAIDVVQKCAELTKNYNIIHIIKHDINQDRINLFELPNLYLKKKEIDCYFTGITKNPPFSVLQNFLEATTENDERNPAVIRKTVHNYNIYTPWTNLDKKDLFKIYKKYNLLDNLFPLTRSCESKNPEDQHTHCGSCWWCEERLWGFGKLK